MRRKGNSTDGFLLCFVLNLFYNYWWGILTLILWTLLLWIRIPLYFPIISLVVWYGVAFASTLLVTWAANASNEPTPVRENLNPYSAKNSDVFGSGNKPNAETSDALHITEQESEENHDCNDSGADLKPDSHNIDEQSDSASRDPDRQKDYPQRVGRIYVKPAMIISMVQK